MISLQLLQLLCVLLPVCMAGWQNDWDKDHKAQCSDGEYVTRVRSTHSNSKEDRRWEVTCGRQGGLRADSNCHWTGYVNNMDDILTFSCPSNKVVTGMHSKHSNSHEDRQFKFLCCDVYAEKKTCADGSFGSECQFRCQCAGGAVCDKVNGTCPGECKKGKYGDNCQLDNNCYYGDNKSLYLGTKSQTKSGKTCQAWVLNKPHKHTYRRRCEFEDGKLPDNFCRATVSDSDEYSPWCYTTDKSTCWESCGVDKCDCPAGRYGENCAKECHCGGSGQCDQLTGTCVSGQCATGWVGEDCQARVEPTPKGCYLTDYVNNWDADMDWRAPHNAVLSGFFSVHSNPHEDRRWKFYVCYV